MARTLSKKEVAQLESVMRGKKPPKKSLPTLLIEAILSLVALIVTTVVKLAFRLVVWLLIQGIKLLRIGFEEGGKGLREMATGKHRGAFLPVWPTVAVLLPLPLAILGWAALGTAFAGVWVAIWAVDHEWSLAARLPGQASPWLRHLGTSLRATGRLLRATWNRSVGRQVFSVRELLIVATYCETVAVWQAVRLVLPAPWSLAVLLLLVMYPVCLWVHGRQIRATEAAKLSKFQETWNARVGITADPEADPKIEARLPELAGHWLSFDDQRHQGVWELDNSLAADVIGKAGEVELALSFDMPEIRRGSLELKHNKRDHVRHLGVRYTPDPIGDAAKTSYFEGPTLDRQGRYLAGVTPAGLAIHGRLIRKGGAAFTIVIGSPGAGKGVVFRTMLANAFSANWVYTVAVDGKGGTGIPWARLGSDLYAMTPEQWALAIELTWEILQARKMRYGKVGKDQWSPFTPLVPGEPCDPLFFLPIDEIQEVVKAWPANKKVRTLASKMETIGAQGRSVGVSGALSTQFGKVDDYWTNVVRTNFMGGGTTFVGKLGGRQAKQVAVQGEEEVDLNTLPDVDGWFVPISRIDDSVPRDAFRGIFLPTEADRQDGTPAPFGVAEEVIPRITRWATLHPEDQAIVDRYRARWETADSGLAVPAGTTPLHSVPMGSGTGEESELDDMTDDGESRVLRALAEANLGTSALAREVDMDRSYLSMELLKRLETEGKITRNDDKTWRRAA